MSEALFPHVRFGEAPPPPRQYGPIEHGLRMAAAVLLRNPDIALQPAFEPDLNVYTRDRLGIPGTHFRLGDSFHDARRDDGSLRVVGADQAVSGGYALYIERGWSDGYQNTYMDYGALPKKWKGEYYHSRQDELVALLCGGDIVPVRSGGDNDRAREICAAVTELPDIPSTADFRFDPEAQAGYDVAIIDDRLVPFISGRAVYEYGKRQRGETVGKRLAYAFGRILGAARESSAQASYGRGSQVVDGIVY